MVMDWAMKGYLIDLKEDDAMQVFLLYADKVGE